MPLDFSVICPREIHADLAWLGKLDWYDYCPGPLSDDGYPRTMYEIKYDVIRNAPHEGVKRRLLMLIQHVASNGGVCNLAWLDSCAVSLAQGPKLFCPTEEQFEAMRHVEINLPPRDFRAPYPSLVVKVPAGSRQRIGSELGMPPDRQGAYTIISWRKKTHGVLVHICSKIGGTNVHHIFQDQPQNPTIEAAISREVGNKLDFGQDPNDHTYGRELARAALNLCLIMTMYGHRDMGPLDPIAYQKHRIRGNLAYLKHGDFKAIELQQETTVRRTIRRPSGDRPEGGPMYEVKPHWVRGHIRRLPGWEAYAERNEASPTTFIRPYMVHPDRIDGDLSETSATYHPR